MSTYYSKFHKMMVDYHGTTADVVELMERVEFVAELRRQRLVETWVSHKTNETVIEFGDVQLRAPISEFPTPAIHAQLLLVFG
jgi:hypothetical protein